MADVSQTRRRSLAAGVRAHCASRAAPMMALLGRRPCSGPRRAEGGVARTTRPIRRARRCARTGRLGDRPVRCARHRSPADIGLAVASASSSRRSADHAACDGGAIDPWHLAAMIEGVRLPHGSRHGDHRAWRDLRGGAPCARAVAGGVRAARRRPRDASDRAGRRPGLSESGHSAPSLLGAALGIRAWLDRGGDRPPLRAALALHWQRCGR